MTKILLLVILGLVLPSNSQAAPNFLPSKWTTGNLVLTGVVGFLGYNSWHHAKQWDITHKNLLTEHGCSKYPSLEMDDYCIKIHKLDIFESEDGRKAFAYGMSGMVIAMLGYMLWNAIMHGEDKMAHPRANLTVTRDSAIVSLKLDF